MPQLLAPILTVLTLAAPPLDTRFEQVAPVPVPGAKAARRDRAVILVHGLGIHPFSKDRITHARLHTWQQPSSRLVRQLAADSDVFAFAYAQTIAVDRVGEAASLADSVRKLRKLGYRQIVLLGHSAGGLIARQLVEDHPDTGVTKVIQVCSPNAGSTLAMLRYRTAQAEFLTSLTKTARRRVLAERASKAIPRPVEFVCVVGTSGIGGDGLVLTRSQWTEDLQKQGVPAYLMHCTHWDAVRSARAAEFLARLVRTPQPRWDAAQVAQVRKRMLGH
jgi:pimeloyl-ACP methyl ester carboxylesterase